MNMFLSIYFHAVHPNYSYDEIRDMEENVDRSTDV